MSSYSEKRGVIIFLFAIMVALIAWMAELSAAPTPDDQACLARAMQTPLVFKVPKAQSDEVWSRLTSFMVKYLKGGVQGKITDSMAATGSIRMDIAQGHQSQVSAYSATRTIKGETVEFSVQSGLLNTKTQVGKPMVFTWSNTDLKAVEQNLHLWALYARTGEIRPELVDKTH